jgi:hypothetical protein
MLEKQEITLKEFICALTVALANFAAFCLNFIGVRALNVSLSIDFRTAVNGQQLLGLCNTCRLTCSKQTHP